MSKSGPPKTPAALKQQRGTFRADRDGGGVNFQPALPECPDWLGQHGTALWLKMAPLLMEHLLMSDAYAETFAGMCESWDEYHRCREEMDGADLFVETEKGYVMQHPAINVKAAAWKRFLEAAKQFGLTPASAASVSTLVSDDEGGQIGNLLNN